MANHPSALKRARQSLKRRARNRRRKTEISSLTKDFLAAGKAEATKLVRTLQSKLAKAARKSTMHWKTAARKTSKLAKAANKK